MSDQPDMRARSTGFRQNVQPRADFANEPTAQPVPQSGQTLGSVQIEKGIGAPAIAAHAKRRARMRGGRHQNQRARHRQVDTPLYRRLIGVAPDADVELPAPNPTGRVDAVDEIAAYVVFLLSDESRFIIRAAPDIDGGATSS